MLSGSSESPRIIVPNSKYRISCWAKLKNAASDTIKLKLKYEDEDGPHFKGISAVIDNNVWTLLEGYITVDEISSGGGTITAAKLFIVGPEAGVEFWVDDVSMEFMNAVTSAPTPSPPTPSPTTKVSYYVCIFGLGFLFCLLPRMLTKIIISYLFYLSAHTTCDLKPISFGMYRCLSFYPSY